MSRIGKKPIPIADKVKVKAEGRRVFVEGPQGNLEWQVPADIDICVKDGSVVVGCKVETKNSRALHGLTRALVANMIKGVSDGCSRELEIIGVGYRAQLEGQGLVMQLGFSHPVRYDPIPGIKLEVIKQTKIIVRGIDKAKVGQTAAEIRRLRPPEPYKGTGIKYADEQIRRKLGKAAGTK